MKALVTGVLMVGVVLVWWVTPRAGDTRTFAIPGDGPRFSVEVLNGTRVDGLARTFTNRLRARGIDVVFFGSALDTTLDSTQILIRMGDSSAALTVRSALGVGQIVDAPDPDRLVDITVILRLDAAALIGFDP